MNPALRPSSFVLRRSSSPHTQESHRRLVYVTNARHSLLWRAICVTAVSPQSGRTATAESLCYAVNIETASTSAGNTHYQGDSDDGTQSGDKHFIASGRRLTAERT